MTYEADHVGPMVHALRRALGLPDRLLEAIAPNDVAVWATKTTLPTQLWSWQVFSPPAAYEEGRQICERLILAASHGVQMPHRPNTASVLAGATAQPASSKAGVESVAGIKCCFLLSSRQFSKSAIQTSKRYYLF